MCYDQDSLRNGYNAVRAVCDVLWSNAKRKWGYFTAPEYKPDQEPDHEHRTKYTDGYLLIFNYHLFGMKVIFTKAIIINHNRLTWSDVYFEASVLVPFVRQRLHVDHWSKRRWNMQKWATSYGKSGRAGRWMLWGLCGMHSSRSQRQNRVYILD